MNRVPPRASGASDRPRADEAEQLEELGDDAIIAQQRGAHLPQPRAQVTEEARSIVISEHATPGSQPPSSPKAPADGTRRKRSERTEKTVVIRDRRQVEDLRREMERRKNQTAQPAAKQGFLLWVIVGVAAFAVGGLIALFATRDESAAPVVKPLTSATPAVSVAPTATAEPPKVSIDELPIEGKK